MPVGLRFYSNGVRGNGMKLIALTSVALAINGAQASSWVLNCCYIPPGSVSDPASPETFVRVVQAPAAQIDSSEESVRRDLEAMSSAAEFASVSSEDSEEGREAQICVGTAEFIKPLASASASDSDDESKVDGPIEGISYSDIAPFIEPSPSIEETEKTIEAPLPSLQVSVDSSAAEEPKPSPPLRSLARGASQVYSKIPSSKWREYDLKRFKPLLTGKVFDYDVSLPEVQQIKPSQRNRAVTFNPYFIYLPKVSLSYFNDEHFDFFATLYPALKGIPMEQKDIAGLLVFGILISFADDYTFFPNKFQEIVNSLRVNFDVDSRILQFFSETEFKGVFQVERALAILFQFAMESDCVYTAEAFFALQKRKFDRSSLFASTEASVKSGSAKIFNRIHAEMIDFDNAELAAHAANHCAMAVFVQMISEHGARLVEDVQERLEIESLFTFLVEKKCHSQALLSHPVWSEEDLDAGLLSSIEVGNWQMFKCFIADEWHTYSSLNPVLKQALRIIYTGKSVPTLGQFLSQLEEGPNPELFARLVEIILKLDCSEPEVTANFTWILQESGISLDSHFSRFNPLEHSLFMNTRDYLEAICLYGNFRLIVNSVPVWDLIKGARDYENLMDSFIHSPNFKLLYAVANPNLTHRNWISIFRKFKVEPYWAHNVSLQHLSEFFAFDSEIISSRDYQALNLQSEKIWSFLHLAVVAFNVRLVDALLDAGAAIDSPLGLDDLRTPLDLAQQILDFLEDDFYPLAHYMDSALIRAQIRNEMRRKHPQFYALAQDPTSATHIRNRAIINCKAIIARLSQVNEDGVRIVAKSNEFSEEDFDI